MKRNVLARTANPGIQVKPTGPRALATLLACSIGLTALLPEGNCWAQASAPQRMRLTQEIAPFRITGVEGYVEARYLRDDNRNSGQAGQAGSRATQSNLVEEVFVMTHSYVYHPTLLSLDIGGGPVLDRGRGETDIATTNTGRQMFNFTSRATILREKPYSGVLFFDHRNQTQSIGPAQTMLTESTRYGFDFALLNPVTPVPLRLNVTHSETQGSGADQILNDRIDQLNLRADANLGPLGKTAFLYRSARQESASGSPDGRIQASRSGNESLNLDTQLQFGANRQFDLDNAISLNTVDYRTGNGSSTEQRDLRFGLNLRGRHSDEIQTFGRYNLSASDRADLTATQNAASAGINYRPRPDLHSSIAVRGENNRTSQLVSNLYGIDGSATYQRALAVGQGTAGYSVAHTQRDQQASARETRIIGEQLTLTGTTLVPLARTQVVAGSMKVGNLTHTQTFVEGSDYVLSVIGVTTRVQRVIGGNILDGQNVLVDYAVETGGTYAVNQLDQAVNLNWGLKDYLNIYLRLADSSPQLSSGTPTAPLNPARSRVYGANADLPLVTPLNLLQDLRLGGRTEWEARRESISPYARASQEVFSQAALPLARSGSVRLGRRQTRIDYDFAPDKGVKLTAYDLRVWARLGYGVDFSVDATRERDTGAPLLRERSLLTAKAQWRVRRFRLSFDLTRSRDAQGATERTRTYAMLLARRDF